MKSVLSPRPFGKTHLQCPCSAKEKGCFAEYKDDVGSGFCFGCNKVISGSRENLRQSSRIHIQPSVRHKLVPHQTVLSSTSFINHFVDVYTSVEGYSEARSAYTEVRALGFDHQVAFVESGWEQFAISRLEELKDTLQSLPSFYRTFIQKTLSPELLPFFHVGKSLSQEITFWIEGADKTFCNGHSIRYNGLSRDKRSNARFNYKTQDGFAVVNFYGAGQLHPAAQSWVGTKFKPTTPVVIVEGPKTAILASYTNPDQIWLASCGTSGVSVAKARALRGRIVRIFFDADDAGRSGAERAMKILKQAGAMPTILDPETAFGGARPDGWDPADEILKMIERGQ
jgi:hypothetical protein